MRRVGACQAKLVGLASEAVPRPVAGDAACGICARTTCRSGEDARNASERALASVDAAGASFVTAESWALGARPCAVTAIASGEASAGIAVTGCCLGAATCAAAVEALAFDPEDEVEGFDGGAWRAEDVLVTSCDAAGTASIVDPATSPTDWTTGAAASVTLCTAAEAVSVTVSTGAVRVDDRLHDRRGGVDDGLNNRLSGLGDRIDHRGRRVRYRLHDRRRGLGNRFRRRGRGLADRLHGVLHSGRGIRGLGRLARRLRARRRRRAAVLLLAGQLVDGRRCTRDDLAWVEQSASVCERVSRPAEECRGKHEAQSASPLHAHTADWCPKTNGSNHNGEREVRSLRALSSLIRGTLDRGMRGGRAYLPLGTSDRRVGQNRGLPKVIVAIAFVAVLAAPAQAARVSVLVVPPFDPHAYESRGAIGLFVPGSGEAASRQGALASLVRGKVEPSSLGGVPGGERLIKLGRKPAAVTIYVALPPPGSHANTRRYPIAIVGGGYHGILVSDSTRIRGLVSIADVAPTARALSERAKPVIRAVPDKGAAAHLARLDLRLTRTHDVRLWATLILVGSVLGGALLTIGLRSRYLSRAGLLAAPAVLAGSLVLSALEVTRPAHVVLWLAVLTIGGSLLVAVPARLLPYALVGLVAAYLVEFAAWPEVNSFAAIGARPDGGGRFYGAGNLVETVLLAVSLEAAALLGRRAFPAVLALVLATVGWSKAGADGGGIVVLLAAFAVLGVRVYGLRLTVRRAVLLAAAVIAVVAALIGLDAATGGSSHVTRALGKGPVSLAGELAHRIHISAANIDASSRHASVFAVSMAALTILGTRRPRFAAGEALLVGIAVSLLVNDSPGDVAAAGALSYAVLWAYERVHEPARARVPTDSVLADGPSVPSRS